MPRESSSSDLDGTGLTPDLEEEKQIYATSPTAVVSPTNHPATTRRTSAPPPLTPKDRFRSAVQKIIAMQDPGEPGLDPRRLTAEARFVGIKQDCIIEFTDYSATRYSSSRMTNREFIHLVNDPIASERKSWVKVRWVNVGGMSWDVIKALSIKYDLHPLALEEMFYGQGLRSKADYYSQHLFLRILCHELYDDDEEFVGNALAPGLADLPRESDSPTFVTDADEETEVRQLGRSDNGKGLHGNSTRRKRRPLLPTNYSDARKAPQSRLIELATMRDTAADVDKKRRLEEATVQALKSGDRVKVKVAPIFIFLLRDGTVISMHSTPNLELTQSIALRLRRPRSDLRSSADASLLVQSLLNIVANKALEVIDAYRVKIKKFEREIMLRPKVTTVANLYILSGDLILHKLTLEPIRVVLNGLRQHDLDRAAALIDMTDERNKEAKVVGFMSHMSKIKLADALEHMEHVLASLEMFAGIGENLIDYTFNMASHEMNEAMRRLTLATITFLPLSLLTGYFGMNFDRMWSVHGHSDLLFWIIALPVMAVVLLMFVMPDLKRVMRSMQMRIRAKKLN
ncbi:magnesium transporter [Mycena latifolia]|nr:magnesium transporter [Mycena latifolia]